MTREEAIKIVKDLYDKSLFLKKDKEAVRTLIPEVEESEDEQIRKEIIALFKGQIHSTSAEDNKKYVAWLEKQSNANKEYWRGYREGKQEILDKYAELEKQGEQKPTGCPEYCVMSNCANCPYRPVLIKKPNDWSEEDERIMNAIYKFLDGSDALYVDQQQAKYWIKSIKDRVQPKSINAWSEDDETMITDLSVIVHTYFSEISGIPFKHDLSEDKIRTWFKSLKDRVQLQDKREWSEDDSAMIDNILGTYKTLEDMLDLTTSQDKDILESMNFERDWIKSLKYRIQPKQEWSEEDEKTIHLACEFIRHHSNYNDSINGIDCPILIERLKSLKPQNTWKPSDEQMEALKVSIYDTIPSKEVMSKVESLYYDLKKLGEYYLL